MAIQITFQAPVIATITMLTNWVEQQEIITVEDWRLDELSQVIITPHFPEQIFTGIDDEMQAEFESFIDSTYN